MKNLLTAIALMLVSCQRPDNGKVNIEDFRGYVPSDTDGYLWIAPDATIQELKEKYGITIK